MYAVRSSRASGVIMRRHGVPIELFGNLKGIIGRFKPKNTPAE
ncbi:MAG TPA: hypothetical protein VGA77_06075 [Propylenella sp.]